MSSRSYYSIFSAYFFLNSLFEIQFYPSVLFCVNCLTSRAWFVQFMQRVNIYSLIRVEEVVPGLSDVGLGSWRFNCPLQSVLWGIMEFIAFYNGIKFMSLWLRTIWFTDKTWSCSTRIQMYFCKENTQRLAARVSLISLFWDYLANACLLIYFYQWESHLEPSLSCQSHQSSKLGWSFWPDLITHFQVYTLITPFAVPKPSFWDPSFSKGLRPLVCTHLCKHLGFRLFSLILVILNFTGIYP